MPLFDFGGGPQGGSSALGKGDSASRGAGGGDGSAAGGRSVGKKKRRVFDFGEDDDDTLEVEEEQPSHGREMLLPSAGKEVLHSPEESSLTPASQKSHLSRAPSMPRLAHAASQHKSAYSQGSGRSSQEPAPAAASIVDRIWQQATPSLSAQKRRQGEEKWAEDDREEEHRARRQEPSETHQRQHHSLQRPSASSLLPGNRPTPSSSVDRIWDAASNRREPVEMGAGLSRNGNSSQHGMFGGEGERHDAEGQWSQPEQAFGSQARPFSQAAGARDAWKERDRQGGRKPHGGRDAADDADHHARQVLLSPPKTAVKGAKFQRDRCASIEYIDGDEQFAAAGGWGAGSARARGRAAGMGDGRGGRGMPNAGMPKDKFFADDGPRPCVPGPAGKLGRVDVGAGRGVGGGNVSPVLQEKGDAGGEEEQDASRDMRQGIALDATGPKLPLRRTFLAMDPRDIDFESKSWRKMLSDLDLLPFTATAPASMTVTEKSPLLRFTIASVVRQNYVKKVPRLLVFVKTLSLEDECASATIKDPTGEMKATIHADVLEEEGELLATGSTLVLRKVTVYNSADGMRHMLIITRNNLVRCFAPNGL